MEAVYAMIAQTARGFFRVIPKTHSLLVVGGSVLTADGRRRCRNNHSIGLTTTPSLVGIVVVGDV